MKEKFSYNFYKTTTEAWDAMYQALLSAQKLIYWEVYILRDDEVGRRFIDLLIKKSKEGVDVKIVVDSVGSFKLSRLAEKDLKNAGVGFVWYNRLYPEWRLGNWFRRVWIRNHRKVLIIDENIAFLGGVNVDKTCALWDDVHIKLEGNIVRPLLRWFAKSYVRCGGDKETMRRFFHPHLTRGLEAIRERVKFIVHSPGFSLKKSFARRLYSRSLMSAQKNFTLLTPYYVPDTKFLEYVSLASARGVEVNILIPQTPDHLTLKYLAQAFYRLTKKAGANLYLLPKMNHGKALCVDDSFGLVGSVNLTPRGFLSNEESGVYFTDKKMITDLSLILSTWKNGARLFTDDFRGINWYQKFFGWVICWFKKYF